MISSTEFETNKWTKIGEQKWVRLGIIVECAGRHYHVKFKYDDPSYCYYSVFKQIDETTMNDLIASIKAGINFIFKFKSHSKRVTQKYKRTLNNWLYVN